MYTYNYQQCFSISCISIQLFNILSEAFYLLIVGLHTFVSTYYLGGLHASGLTLSLHYPQYIIAKCNNNCCIIYKVVASTVVFLVIHLLITKSGVIAKTAPAECLRTSMHRSRFQAVISPRCRSDAHSKSSNSKLIALQQFLVC